MKIIEIRSLAVPDVKLVRFVRFRDDRGYFCESYRRGDFETHPQAACFRGVQFVQHNESYSRAGTIRGLHFQWNPAMGKLVRTVAGRMVDLAMDIRQGSPWFGKIIACDMPAAAEDDVGQWIWVPAGFAHGNFFPEPTTIEYLCTAEYNPACEAGISPLAADLDWSLCERQCKGMFDCLIAGATLLSEKDRAGFTLAQWNDDPRSGNFVYGRP